MNITRSPSPDRSDYIDIVGTFCGLLDIHMFSARPIKRVTREEKERDTTNKVSSAFQQMGQWCNEKQILKGKIKKRRKKGRAGLVIGTLCKLFFAHTRLHSSTISIFCLFVCCVCCTQQRRSFGYRTSPLPSTFNTSREWAHSSTDHLLLFSITSSIKPNNTIQRKCQWKSTTSSPP